MSEKHTWKEHSAMKSLWALRNISWFELCKRVWREANDDRLFGRAAELSYYFLLALFPLLIFMTSAIGIVMGSDSGLRRQLFSYLARIMPQSAFQLVNATITEVSLASSGSKLSLGLLAALWAASNGMSAITDSLNAAYDIEEGRPWWKQRLVAITLTITLSILIISALLLVVAGGHIAEGIANAYGFGGAFQIGWKIMQWPIVLAFIILTFALIYYFAPDLRKQKWQWLTPGAAVGVALWLVISLGFRVYLHFFDTYSKTYGSLGAVIILMLWLYFTGAAVLIGGETNSEIEKAAAERGAPDAKKSGEKSPGESETRESLIAER